MFNIISFHTFSFTNETSKISASATLSEIFDHFKNPLHGVGFLGQTQSLPSFTFVSSDAINWLKNRIDGPCSPVQILEAMREYIMSLNYHFSYYNCSNFS